MLYVFNVTRNNGIRRTTTSSSINFKEETRNGVKHRIHRVYGGRGFVKKGQTMMYFARNVLQGRDGSESHKDAGKSKEVMDSNGSEKTEEIPAHNVQLLLLLLNGKENSDSKL